MSLDYKSLVVRPFLVCMATVSTSKYCIITVCMDNQPNSIPSGISTIVKIDATSGFVRNAG